MFQRRQPFSRRQIHLTTVQPAKVYQPQPQPKLQKVAYNHSHSANSFKTIHQDPLLQKIFPPNLFMIALGAVGSGKTHLIYDWVADKNVLGQKYDKVIFITTNANATNAIRCTFTELLYYP